MKTAISVPDEIFDEGEHLAKRLKVSRSELYARALAEFVSRHAPEAVTEALDLVCDRTEADADFARRAAKKTLRRAEW